MQDSIDVTRDDTESFRIMMFNLICLFLPRNRLEGVMRVRNDFTTSTEIRSFVFKHIVTDSHDHSLVEVRPCSEDSLTNMFSGDLVR